jgi:hypothetical protein
MKKPFRVALFEFLITPAIMWTLLIAFICGAEVLWEDEDDYDY